MEELYLSASKILDSILLCKGSAKTLCLNSKDTNKKVLYALVCESLKYRLVIKEILQIACLSHLSFFQRNLSLVLIYDFLFGGGLRCGGRYKYILNKHKDGLQVALQRLKLNKNVKTVTDLLPPFATLPCYVRVNLLKTTITAVFDHFKSSGFIFIENYFQGELKKKHFAKDSLLNDLFILPASADLHEDFFYKEGLIIIQDKASCFPAHVLRPPIGSSVIDACAAPGNKTSHLAAFMNNTGIIYAFDLNKNRLKTLRKLHARAGVTCVVSKLQNFLEVDPWDPQYAKVGYILVDPSCSGSGIVGRHNLQTDDNDNKIQKTNRLKRLSAFQLSLLLHAFQFPSVQRVCYSTCSIHVEENESVVKIALSLQKKFVLAPILPTWHRRGDEAVLGEDAKKVVRVSPVDGANGFFVALFQKK